MAASSSLGGQPMRHVVACIDADCFYAQVEHRRLSIPRDKPLAVQQWEGLIAVNYPARKFGVRRGDRVEEALRKCPELICVHVETIGGSGGSGSDGSKDATTHDRSAMKVSLERYREASHEIMAIIQRYASVVEKASVDEAYVAFKAEDLPAMATYDEEQQGEEDEGEDREREREQQHAVADDDGGWRKDELTCKVLEGHMMDPSNAVDLSLLLAARVVSRIRRVVREELGFTLSAGIAWNKMLAKLASAKFKPNQQTVVPLAAVQSLLSSVPINELRGLGGKLGEAVQRWSPQSKTVADLQRHSREELIAQFGQKSGSWLHKICRGWDEEAVTPNLICKSILAFKSFEAVDSVDGVQAWLKVLSQDLATRIDKDREANHRRPRTLLLQYRGGLRPEHLKNWVAGRVADLTPMVSRSSPMPSSSLSQAALLTAAMSLFAKCGGQSALPCTRLALGASDFVDMPSEKGSIRGFFGVKAASSAAIIKEPSADYEAGETTATESSSAMAVGGSSSGGREDERAGLRKTEAEPAVAPADGGGGKASAGILGFFQKTAASAPPGSSSPASDLATVVSEQGEPPLGSVAAAAGADTNPWCPRCPGERILMDQEHEDYHFALDLQGQEGGPAAGPAAWPGSSSSSSRDTGRGPPGHSSRSKRTSVQQKRGSIDKFLTNKRPKE